MIFFPTFVFLLLCASVHSGSLQIYGSAKLGYYYVNIYVGSPPQLQTLILDTGSWLTAIPCNECTGEKCGVHHDNPFDLRISNTSRKIKCGESFSQFHCITCSDDKQSCVFEIRYSEGSQLQGFYFEDVINLEDTLTKTLINTKFLMGCTTEETNLFKKQYADGIMGLGINTNRQYRMPNIIDYFYKEKHSETLRFSLCLSHIEGGFLSIGERNVDRHLPGMKTYTIPVSRESGQYNINVHGMKFGDTTLDVHHQDFEYEDGAFIDSGTTLFYAHHKIYYAIVEHFGEFCTYSPQCQAVLHATKCYQFDPNKFKTKQEFWDIFPNMTFFLDDDFAMQWRPQDYLYNYGSNPNLYCLAIEKTEGKVIFGAITMRNWDIDFDRENAKLHFTRSDCAKGWDANLSPKHKNRNLGPEISEPRILANVTSQNDLNGADSSHVIVNGTNVNNLTNDQIAEDSNSDSQEANKVIMGTLVIILVFILVLSAVCYAYIRRRRLAKSELSKMIPKNAAEAPARSDYQKPVENSLPNQISHPNPPQPIMHKNKNNSNNVYQIDDNEISNSIDMNYEINMDNNTPGMHFSNINFDNIDRKKSNQKSPSSGI